MDEDNIVSILDRLIEAFPNPEAVEDRKPLEQLGHNLHMSFEVDASEVGEFVDLLNQLDAVTGIKVERVA